MFRELRRPKQALSKEQCIEVLKAAPRGILSMLGDDGYPYGIPLTHYYDEESGKIYFHGAAEGHKIDAIKGCDKVSFCVLDKGYKNEGDWVWHTNSVIVFGRIHFVEDHTKALQMCVKLAKKHTDSPEYVKNELESSGHKVLALELEIEHISGKAVNEC